MVDLSAIFSEIKRLLAIASAPRQDHDTTPPIISASSPEPISNLRDPNTYRNGIPVLPPPAYAPHSYYHGLHIPPLYASGHSSSVTDNHPSPTPPTHPREPTSWGPPPPPLQTQNYNRSGSDISIIIPPPAYNSGDRPPAYSYSESFGVPVWQTVGVRNGSFVEFLSLRRSRISPVVGPAWGYRDPSQNRYPGSLPGQAPRHGRDMHRGTLFARVIPARRNLWLPAIVVSAVVGVYVLVKVGGRDKDTNK